MNISRGAGLHFLFWIVYFGVNLFNDLFLSPSFTAHPSAALFFNSVKAQLLVLAIKVPAVYYVLYALIPRWTASRSRLRLTGEAVAVFIVLLLCYRGMVQFIIRPFIYGEPYPPMTLLQHTARFFNSLLDLLQATGIAAAIKLFGMRISAVRREQAMMKEKLQSEMHYLRAQINPHFLFNTLNSIYALSRNMSAATPDAVMRLSKILRYMLYATEQKTVPIGEELRITMDYIELQQIRYGTRVRLQLEQHIDEPSAPITPQVLLPLIENAFKHGTSEVRGTAEIGLRIMLNARRLHVVIRNSVGEAAAQPAARKEGIGLANMRRRLELLYRDHRFEYDRREDNFVVDLYINLDSYADLELSDHRG